MKNKLSFSLVFLTIIVSVLVFVMGFSNVPNRTMVEGYQVYLNGNLLGFVESKEEFLSYINNKQESLKKKYNVDMVYAPKGVEIKKVTTYSSEFSGLDSIYNMIMEEENFTIPGVVVNVNYGEDDVINYTNDSNEVVDSIKKEDKIIYVLDKKIFDTALEKTIKVFMEENQYNNYMNNSQEEIKDLGVIVQDVDIKQDVTYREDLISVKEKIFTDVDELSKYLLYGTLEKQQTYVVQDGDTIADVASKNKLNVKEFLIANPVFTSENNLLYSSQEVVVGLINPIIDVVVTTYSVEEQSKTYSTEEQIDDTKPLGYEEEIRTGEEGLYKVSYNKQFVNGQVSEVIPIGSTEIKPAVNRVIIKGSKIIPSVANLSYWAWPTATPYSITSGYGYRWGSFHAGIDISGTGYGSPIYAANNGEIYETGSHPSMGNYVMIKHNTKDYYTVYMHMKSISVKEGQVVGRGQQIGQMGNTGYVVPAPSKSRPTAGTHLHFALYVGAPYSGGRHVNPWVLFK